MPEYKDGKLKAEKFANNKTEIRRRNRIPN